MITAVVARPAAARQAAQPLLGGVVHPGPGRAQRTRDGPRILAGPETGAGVPGVAPGQDLRLGQLGAATVAVLPPLAQPGHGQTSPLWDPGEKASGKTPLPGTCDITFSGLREPFEGLAGYFFSSPSHTPSLFKPL